MRKTKLLVSILSLVLILSIFAGCQSSGMDATQATTPSTEPIELTEATEPTEDSTSDDFIELGIVEEKIICTATLEDNFADNRIVVVLNNKASLNFKEYTPADFEEINCVAVDDLSTGARKKAQTRVANFMATAKTMSDQERAAAAEEINRYNQILCLVLAEKSKENVLAAIKVLESRDDVKSAGPDYVMSLT